MLKAIPQLNLNYCRVDGKVKRALDRTIYQQFSTHNRLGMSKKQKEGLTKSKNFCKIILASLKKVISDVQ
ncbi:hypothetical protein DRZ78_00715 [Candidatus Aerophobetes bacterium]|uniref:Uncharacterized protein n=1 Tax=Aerophobetes bacterium TaxID=2030807 RepID=A0A662D5K9_UNCAE|nr:MAG: hypothetical protein DRZ78_00715 [Candidatus Aerophobetes bacterium]